MIIKVSIGKNKYNLDCRPEEVDAILEYADRLDQRVKELAQNIENASDAHLLVIAGLMLEQDLQQKTAKLGQQKVELYTKDELYEALGEQMYNVSNYIEKIIAKIEKL